MKKIITVVLFIVLSEAGFAQSWVKKGDFSDSVTAFDGTYYGVSSGNTFVIGDTGYLIGGANCFTGFNDTWIYDTLNNTWDTVAPYPSGYGGGGSKAAFAINGKGYVGTGSYFGPFTQQFFQYDPHTDRWTSEKNFLGAARGYDVGFAISGRGFIGLGQDGSGYGNDYYDFYEYTPATNSWTSIANYPGNGNQYNFAFVIGDKAYVGGGNASATNTVCDDFWEYDTISKVWTKVATFPGGPRWQGFSFGTCSKGYIGSGVNASGNRTTDFWEFDPSKGDSGTWTQLTSLPTGYGTSTPAFFAIGKSLFTGMGTNNTEGCGATDDWWEYIPSVTPAFTTAGGSATTICTGQTVSFVDTSNFSPTNWYWQFPGATPDTSTAQNPTVSYNSAGSYPITFTAWNSCDSASKTFTDYITVNSPSPLTINSNPPLKSLCNGESVTLNVTNSGTFTWSPSTGLSSTTGNTVIATPTISTTYTVTENNSGGCLAIGTDTISVVTAPPLIIQPQSPKVCNGQGVTLYAPASGSGYTWSSSSALSPSGDSATATPTVTSTYSVTGTDSLGCVATGTDSVYVVTAPPLIIQPEGPQSVCPGQSIALSVPVSGRNYQWLPSATLKPDTGDTVLAYPVIQVTYIVSGIDSLGCSVQSDSEVVSVSNAPNKPTITVSGDVLTSSATQGNQWVRNDSLLNGANGENYIAIIPGWYQVIAENPANGCSTTSDSVDITSGINQLSVTSNQLSIYPNPTGGEIYLTISSSVGELRDWNLQITDVLGRTVYTRLSLNYSNAIDLSKLASGVYFITVINKTGEAVFPVIRQN